jgi:Family of unknown function (DUF5677)
MTEQTSPPGASRPEPKEVAVAADALMSLVAEQLPRQFPPGGDPWDGYAAAMVVRIGDIVRSIKVLMDDTQAIDGGILLRVLYEHVVKFCWIAIDPSDRYRRWGSDALIQTRKLHNDALPYGFTVLDANELAAANAANDTLPDVASMANEVDTHWGGKIDGFQPRIRGQGQLGLITIRGMYIPVYRTISEAVHCQPEVIDAYINAGTPMWPVGPTAAASNLWWPLAVVLYAQALLVCHETLGAPNPDRVRAINNAMYGA